MNAGYDKEMKECAAARRNGIDTDEVDWCEQLRKKRENDDYISEDEED